ncbi:MAG TPA: matrixin family metalloprotease [Bryobacteraceae bacterium]|nr:matrixin family metalloprotease [Bryobacteraceae bacterium]
MKKLCLRLLALFAVSLSAALATPANWTGEYAPCDRHNQLLSHDHIDLGVRATSANPLLDRAFLHAMDFWAGVLDMTWHEADSSDCAVELVDGAKSLFETPGVAARSQYPDRADFEGWVAFNPASKLTEQQMFVISVHEIGHLLGLPHNPSGSSVMYFFTLDESVWLDSADLSALAARHKLRSTMFESGRLVSHRLPTP